jgi:triosephosphate isomerase
MAGIAGMTRPMIGTSWKMNLTASEAGAWFSAAVPALSTIDDRDLFVLPPFTAIHVAREALCRTAIAWGAQDVHPDDAGAHTGDVSAAMLADLGCRIVEVGHSERRRDHRETGPLIAAKVGAIRRHGMTPLVCVGERSPGPVDAALRFVRRQLRDAFGALDADALGAVIVAYEPVWAIGVGAMAAPLDHIAAMHTGIRRWLAARGAPSTPVLYGGSVDASNAEAIADLAGVGGLFVGRAALDPQTFVRIAGIDIQGGHDRER